MTQYTFTANPFAKHHFNLAASSCTADDPATAVKAVFGEEIFKKHVISHTLTADQIKTSVTDVRAILNPEIGNPRQLEIDYVGKLTRLRNA